MPEDLIFQKNLVMDEFRIGRVPTGAGFLSSIPAKGKLTSIG